MMVTCTTYNIQYGKGRDEFYDLPRTIKALRTADIVALQEVDTFWDRSGNCHQAEIIARELGGYHWIYGPTIDLHKLLERPDSKSICVRRQFGNAIISRWPILSSRTFLYPKLNPLNAHSIQRGITEATIKTPLGLWRVYSTHLSHLCDEERQEHAQIVLDIHKRAITDGPAMSGPHRDESWLEAPPPSVPSAAVLMGDFNFTPDRPAYSLLCGGVSHAYGRLHQPDRLVDAWTAAGHDEDEGHTAFSEWAEKRGKRIDYVFVSPCLVNAVRSAHVDIDTAASDHQPLTVSFSSD